jgi:hypothetical protein
MAKMILNLPLGIGKRGNRPKSQFHTLFLQISDGQWWVVEEAEWKGKSRNPKAFRTVFMSWARTRGMNIVSRFNPEARVFYLKTVPIPKEDPKPRDDFDFDLGDL